MSRHTRIDGDFFGVNQCQELAQAYAKVGNSYSAQRDFRKAWAAKAFKASTLRLEETFRFTEEAPGGQELFREGMGRLHTSAAGEVERGAPELLLTTSVHPTRSQISHAKKSSRR